MKEVEYMPNWCEGCMRVRGTFENVKKFLTEHVHGWKFNVDNFTETVDENATETLFSDEICYNSDVHIDNTTRAFICECSAYINKRRNGMTVTTVPFKQAWAICADEFAAISKECNVDFNITGYEQGLEYVQRVTVVNGEIIKDEQEEYDDYQWECDMPILGG